MDLKNGIVVETFVKILLCVQMQNMFLRKRIDDQRLTARMSQDYLEE